MIASNSKENYGKLAMDYLWEMQERSLKLESIKENVDEDFMLRTEVAEGNKENDYELFKR